MVNLSYPPSSELAKLYEQDFCLWLDTTAQLLKEGRFAQIDIDNLIEEIESMARSERRELKNRLRVLLEHLLKLNYWQQEKEYNQRGWTDTIIEQRRQIEKLIEDSPSLKSLLLELFSQCYNEARKDTIAKTGLSPNTFPPESPFSLEDVLESELEP